MKKTSLLCFFLCFSLLVSPVFGADNKTTNYDDIQFPQWTKDLRRTEIITFGSLPFVTLWTTLGYGLAVKGSFHNPLDKSTSNYTQEEQKQIMMIAASASLALGLTDLAINLITRKIAKNKQDRIQKNINVIPLSKIGTDGQDLPEPQLPFEEERIFDAEKVEDAEVAKNEYYIGEMENAIF